MKYDVFISYSWNDASRETAREISKALVKDGVKAWFDEETMLPGDSYSKQIHEALSQCKFVIAVVAPEKNQQAPPQTETSHGVACEIDKAEHLNKLIIPVVIDGASVQDIPPEIRDRAAVFWDSEHKEKAEEQILRAVKGTTLAERLKEYLTNE